MKQCEWEQLRAQGFTVCGEGFSHIALERDGLIYKCSREPDAYDTIRYTREKAVLDFLRERGYPAVRVREIVARGDILEHYAFLVEEKAPGCNLKKNEIDQARLHQVFDYMMDAAGRLKMPFWGDTAGRQEDWISFLRRRIHTEKWPGYEQRVAAMLRRAGAQDRTEAGFLFLDANPENFFWDADGQVCGIIDIDHPICGDPLYQLATIQFEWGHRAREYVKKHVTPEESALFQAYLAHVVLDDLITLEKLGLILDTQEIKRHTDVLDAICPA